MDDQESTDWYCCVFVCGAVGYELMNERKQVYDS